MCIVLFSSMIMFSDCHWIYLLPLFLGIICQSDRLSVRLWHCIQNGCTYHRRGMRNSCDHNTCVRTVWSRWMLTHNVGICDGLPSCLSVNERCPILRCLTRSMRACVRYANTCIPDAAKSYPIKLVTVVLRNAFGLIFRRLRYFKLDQVPRCLQKRIKFGDCCSRKMKFQFYLSYIHTYSYVHEAIDKV